jgi:hypothetical protein
MKQVVDAIAAYYHEVALAEAYDRISNTQEDVETFVTLAKKHHLRHKVKTQEERKKK